MKYLVFSTILIWSILPVTAQEKSESDIQIPGTPGMNIIGIQSTEISKPGNYTGLYTSLVSPIVSNNGTIPTDLSLEFSPYYLESRNITYNELKKTDVYRDMKISVASTNVTISDSLKYSRMGIGFKTSFLNGNYTAPTKIKAEEKLSLANDIETVIFKISVDSLEKIDTADINGYMIHIAGKNNDLKNKIRKIIEKNQDNRKSLLNKLEDLKTKAEESIQVDDSRWNYSLRTGSFLEFAGAIALDFPLNDLRSNISRWGFWMNYTLRPNNNLGIFDFGAIIRISNYSFDQTIIFESKALFGDIGSSLNFRIPDTGFTLACEFIGKFGFSELESTAGDNSYTFKSVKESKWNLSVGYRISENVQWCMSFSEIKGNSDYLKDKTMQLLMGISASLVPLKD